MSPPACRTDRMVAVFFAAVAGFVLSAVFLTCTGLGLWLSPKPKLTLPMPHHVPKTPGGVSLRFAMVQDVIHERYAYHGPAYFTERNRLTREKLKTVVENQPYHFGLLDDVAIGLERLGAYPEAERVLRDKLERQTAVNTPEAERYTSYANLGTVLIHAHTKGATAGDDRAKAKLREGLEFIRSAIAVNPNAHFGREVWQAVTVEFLLAADDPKLLRGFDLVGNALTEELAVRSGGSTSISLNYYWAGGSARDAARLVAESEQPDSPADWSEKASSFREAVKKVGAEEGWERWPVPSHRKPVPFDEPTLGIIGMWRQGGSESPHFALCLAETMLRVGQRYLAWTAYERASRLADRFWPDPDLQQFLRDHCRRRQAAIETTLPPNDVAELRPRFDEELAFGERYQDAHHRYESERIAAGAAIDDPHFYDAFHTEHGPIASPVGPEDEFVIEDAQQQLLNSLWATLGIAAFFGGLAAFLTAVILARRTARPLPD